MSVEGYSEVRVVRDEMILLQLHHPPHYTGILSHWHADLEVIFVLEGELHVLCGGFSGVVLPGEVVVVNPNQLHAATSGNTYTSYLSLRISGRFVAELAADPVGTRHLMPIIYHRCHFRTLIRDNEIGALLHRIFWECRCKESIYELALRANLVLLLTRLIRCHVDKGGRFLVVDAHFEQVLNYVHEHFTEKLSTKDIAARFFLNKCHFCRRFKAQTGMSFLQYLDHLRMDLACSLLSTTTLPIGVIACRCGYRDSNQFSRKFRLRYAMTARDYRQRAQEWR